MKTFRIILLILTIIGVVALITQKTWVPKLVDKILSSEDLPLIKSVLQSDLVLKDGHQCYAYSHDGTKTEPYTVNEFININIAGTKVTGEKKGAQSGPDMTNGYTGTIVGNLEDNMITDIYSYKIEGSTNKEVEVYGTTKTGLKKLRYPLVEDKGMLIPDMTKTYQVMNYARVECTGSN